ncbi:hypothetical protein VTJ04DRAFT_5623 [Mycothermus thermophilus]|uniref:uncharacterized protein n=1 Tax=Humicola insolens TaxID=85995 RepID=UPI003742F032
MTDTTSHTPNPGLRISFPFNPLTTTFTRDSKCGAVTISVSDKIEFYIIDLREEGQNCYWTACQDNDGVASITTVVCCPTYNSDITLTCETSDKNIHDMETDAVIDLCFWTAGETTALTAVTWEAGSTFVVDFYEPDIVRAEGVYMVYQSSDLNGGSGAETTTTSEASPGHDSAASDTATSSSTSEAPPSSPPTSGLTPAELAMAIVGPIILLALLLATIYFWRKSRKL